MDLNGLRVAKATDGELTWIHSDHLHSATILTDADGTEIRRLAYAAFGEELENTGSGTEAKYSYTGKERDQSGLLYYGARYYDPALARFITADTVYDAGPQGLNRYSYALNNPILYRDPSGHYVVQVNTTPIRNVNTKIREYVGFLPDFILDAYLPVTDEDIYSAGIDQVMGMGTGMITGPSKKAVEEVVEGVADYGKKVVKEALEESGDDVLEHGTNVAQKGLQKTSERLTKEAVEDTSRKRLQKRIGKKLQNSSDAQYDYIDNLGKRYDQMGNPNMIPFWEEESSQFFKQIERHLDKADFTVIDLTDFPKNIQEEVGEYILDLPQEQFDKIIPIGF